MNKLNNDKKELPLMDRRQPSEYETATFGLG